MKLTVNKYLNARQGAPSTAAPNPMYHHPGTILTIDKVHAGTAIQGNSIWYHCPDDGYFYWSGGFAETDFQLGATHLHDFTEEEQVRILLSVKTDTIHQLEKAIGDDYNGSGVSVDNNAPGKYALIIFTTKDIRHITHVLFRGILVPVTTSTISDATLFTFWDTDSPLKMGGSIGRDGVQGHGSRTLKVKKDNVTYLLTCFHVLLKEYMHIGRYKSTSQNPKLFAGYPFRNAQTSDLKYQIVDGIYNSGFDYAVALIPDYLTHSIENHVGKNDIKIKECYTYNEQIKSKGKKITVYGCMTEKKEGEIITPCADMKIKPNSFKTTNIIIADDIAQHGDSGAPVIDEDNRLVGYVIGGSKASNQTYIMPFYKIAEKGYIAI